MVLDLEVAEADRVAHEIDQPAVVANGHAGLEAEPFGELDALTDRVDRTARRTGLVEGDEQVVGGPLGETLDEDRVELRAVGGAVGVEPEAFVVGDLGDAEDLAQRRNWRSLAAVMITSRSFVGIGW